MGDFLNLQADCCYRATTFKMTGNRAFEAEMGAKSMRVNGNRAEKISKNFEKCKFGAKFQAKSMEKSAKNPKKRKGGIHTFFADPFISSQKFRKISGKILENSAWGRISGKFTGKFQENFHAARK